MNICFFTPLFPPQYSGAAFQAITLAKELQKNGETIFFVTLRDDPGSYRLAFFRLEQYENFDIIILPVERLDKIIEGTSSIKDYLFILIKIMVAMFLLRKRYSIIHCHTLGFPFTGITLIARLLKKKIVGKATMSDDLEIRKIGRITGLFNYISIYSFNKIIAISKDIYKTLLDKGLPSRKVEYITNSIDTNIFFPVNNVCKAQLKERLHIVDDFVAIFIGGITLRKGIDLLIKIWAEFAKKYQNTILILVGPMSASDGTFGDDFCVDYVKRYIKHNELDDRVIFTGKIKNVQHYLQISDLFIFPSTMEGMPNVVLEAMACGLPIVSFEVSGINDIISNKYNGEVISKGDITGLYRAIEKIYSSEKLHKQYSKNAVITIREKFSVQIIAKQYQDLYANL